MDSSFPLNRNNTKSEHTNSRHAFWLAVFLAISSLSAVVFFIMLIGSNPAWQVYTFVGLTLAALIIYGFSAWHLWRGSATLGLKTLYWTPIFLLPASTLLMNSIALVLIVMMLLVGFTNVFFLQPREWRKKYQAGPIIAAIVMALIETVQPAFRLTLITVSSVLGPVILIFLILGILALIIQQSWISIRKSLRLQITILTGTIIFVVAVLTIGYNVITARQAAIENAREEATFLALAESEKIKIQIDPALNTAQTLANLLGAVRDPRNPIQLTREQANGILRKIVVENPSFLGAWTLWEPNAFDRQDAQYVNTPIHDETGRFIPYWVRTSENAVEGIAIVDYQTPIQGVNDWYFTPRETQQTMLLSPYFYTVNDVDILMTTIVVPIVENGRFYGVVGVDNPVAFVQSLVDNVNLFNGTVNAVLFTDDGALVAVRNQPELSLQPATTVFEDFADIQSQLANNETFSKISPDGQFLRIFAPVNLVEGSDWTFALVIPFSEITAPATAIAIQQALISMIVIGLALIFLWFLTGLLVRPIGELTSVANAITQGNMNVIAEVRSLDETGTLANAFNTMTAQLRNFIGTLEDRVAERTRGLELAAEVGRAVSQVRSLDVMLTDAAELIRAQFNLYYVQVYLINPGQTHLILEAGTGEAGRTLLERKHQLPLNTNSLNGRAAVERKSVVIENTLRSITFKPNPLLPDTRSEMAIPLMVGEKVVGVLDMQSMQEEGLKQELLPAFEALAGQLAVAIQNANLLAEAEQARTEVEAQTRRLARSNWVEYLDAINMPERTGFIFEQNQVLPLNETETPQISEENAVVAPISITGEVVGSLVVELDENTSPAASESDLVEEVARQVALHIESLRLLETAERFRSEAEEASHRLTREGWKDYVQTHTDQPLSFYYDLNEVQPLRGLNTYQQDESALNLPLKVREETIGKLAIQGIDRDNSEALELANAIAERLSAHIESLRQFEETRRNQIELDKRAQELAAVAEISTISSKELDIQRMLETVVHLTQRKFGYYHAHVFLFDENKQHLKIAACGWKEGDEHEGSHGSAEISLMQEQSLVARAARSREAVIVNDVRKEPGWLPNPLLPDTASELAVPLVIGDQLLGVLDVQSDRLDAFNEEDANIQATLASQVATALQNARSFDRAQKQAERESMLNAINQKIQSATSVESVLQIAARELGHALGAPMTIAQLSMKDTSS